MTKSKKKSANKQAGTRDVKKEKNKAVKRVNPFDLKFNRVKHNVLGKLKDVPVGAPMASRKKAFADMERRLGTEYRNEGKTNTLVDKRIGEKNTALSAEERASKRFTEQRQTTMKAAGGNKYNLPDGDEDLLTHGGRALTAIEKYDRVQESDDDDDEGRLGADLVAAAHFGGGISEDGSKPRDRKEIVAEMILKSKTSKKERQEATEDQANMADALDSKLSALLKRGALTQKAKKEDEKKEIRTHDEYDSILSTLQLTADKKGRAVDARKTVEEEAADERARMERMETDRLMRMNMQKNASSHYSADDDAARAPLNAREKSTFVLKFDKDGKAMLGDEGAKSSTRRVGFDSDDEGDEDLEDEEEDLDDLMRESGEESEEEEEEEALPPAKKSKAATVKDVKTKSKKNVEEKETKQQIPFTFPMPSSYAELGTLLDKYDAEDTPTVIERLIKCHHPSLGKGNKAALERVFLFCLRRLTETARKVPTPERLAIIGALTRPLYDLLDLSRENGTKLMRALLRGEWRSMEGKKPPLFTLPASIRLVGVLYPPSNVFHPVCTPAFIVATQSLGRVQLRSLAILGRQLLLLTALSDYVDESHRYMPEVMAFLRGCLMMAVPGEPLAPPSTAFPVNLPMAKMLLVEEKVSGPMEALAPAELYADKEKGLSSSNPIARAQVLRIVITVLKKFTSTYAYHSDTYNAMFRPILVLLRKLPIEFYPGELREEVDCLVTAMAADVARLAPVVQLGRMKTERSMLPMLEPTYEDDFDPDNKWKGGKKNERADQNQKMRRLMKKETRGAIKTLRQNNAFISQKRIKEKASQDRDRKVKTKKLLASLAGQEGEARKEESRKKWEKR